MNIIKPKKLQKGDTISIVAPAGVVSEKLIIKAKNNFEKLGFNVIFGKNVVGKSKNYLSAQDDLRLSDLHEAFLNPEIDGIMCARGGYGCLRLIENIDYELVKNNPKFFCGYSDITILNAMFLKKANLVTFSAPMLQSDFSAELDEYTLDNLNKTMTGKPLVISPTNSKSYNYKDCEGILFGGNLSTITTLCGVEFIPDDKFIFFAEDLNEPAYKIDRYFTQLFNIEKFRANIKAIILGDFLDIDNETYLEDLIREISDKNEIPVISGYPITHAKKKASIPYGAKANLVDKLLKIENYTT